MHGMENVKKLAITICANNIYHAHYSVFAGYKCFSGRCTVLGPVFFHRLLVPKYRYQPHTLHLSFACFLSHFLTPEVQFS